MRIRLALWRIVALVRLWRLLVKCRPDIAWIGSSVALPFLLVCRMAMVRTIVHVHEHANMTEAHPQRVALLRRLAHGMIFVGPKCAEPFRPRPRRQPWAVITNPMDEPRRIDAAERAERRRSHGAADSDVVFVCAAFLNPRKDHETLLRAFAASHQKAAGIRLWIVGDDVPGHGGTRERLESLAGELSVKEHVQFLGVRDDVSALLQAGDVCVLASREEAMPLSIAEAQLAARPVVATNVGDIPLMVPHDRCGLIVEPGDTEALSTAMTRLAQDAELRRHFGQGGQRRALRLYAADSLLPHFARFAGRVAGH